MQRIISLFLIIILTFSCSNEIEYRNPALQGTKNYESWFANNFQAALTDDGGVRIIGVVKDESLTFTLSDVGEGTYVFGSSALNSAVFEDADFKTYSTLNNGDGEIVVEDYDIVNLAITGTFSFNSYSTNGELVNFIYGIFHKIPLDSATNELTGSNSFNANVNSNVGEINLVETEVLDNELYIKASYLDNSSIEFFVPNDIQVGGYTLNVSTTTYANYVFSDGVQASSQYGTLTILEHDFQFNKIKASFLFNTGNPHNIAVSNGNFVIYY